MGDAEPSLPGFVGGKRNKTQNVTLMSCEKQYNAIPLSQSLMGQQVSPFTELLTDQQRSITGLQALIWRPKTYRFEGVLPKTSACSNRELSSKMTRFHPPSLFEQARFTPLNNKQPHSAHRAICRKKTTCAPQ